jgi:hypothetical protein
MGWCRPNCPAPYFGCLHEGLALLVADLYRREMGDFSSVSKFRVQLVNGDGSSDRVIVQIGEHSTVWQGSQIFELCLLGVVHFAGLDGFKILDAGTNRSLRSLELGHISRLA